MNYKSQTENQEQSISPRNRASVAPPFLSKPQSGNLDTASGLGAYAPNPNLCTVKAKKWSTSSLMCQEEPQGSKDPNDRALGPKYYRP